MNPSYFDYLQQMEAADDMEILAEAMKTEIDSGWLERMQEEIGKIILRYKKESASVAAAEK